MRNANSFIETENRQRKVAWRTGEGSVGNRVGVRWPIHAGSQRRGGVGAHFKHVQFFMLMTLLESWFLKL